MVVVEDGAAGLNVVFVFLGEAQDRHFGIRVLIGHWECMWGEVLWRMCACFEIYLWKRYGNETRIGNGESLSIEINRRVPDGTVSSG